MYRINHLSVLAIGVLYAECWVEAQHEGPAEKAAFRAFNDGESPKQPLPQLRHPTDFPLDPHTYSSNSFGSWEVPN